MSFPPVDLTDSIGSLTAYALGLRQDADYRTNVGIVNLDSVAHTWTISIYGLLATGSFRVSVAPCSITQAALPTGTFGDLFLTLKSDGYGFWWSAYGASVDNATGDGWVSHAAQ